MVLELDPWLQAHFHKLALHHDAEVVTKTGVAEGICSGSLVLMIAPVGG
jgi:hypothetical protein